MKTVVSVSALWSPELFSTHFLYLFIYTLELCFSFLLSFIVYISREETKYSGWNKRHAFYTKHVFRSEMCGAWNFDTPWDPSRGSRKPTTPRPTAGFSKCNPYAPRLPHQFCDGTHPAPVHPKFFLFTSNLFWMVYSTKLVNWLRKKY